MGDSKKLDGRPDRRLRPWGLLTALGSVLTTATVLSFMGRLGWFFDLFSHFHVQYLLALTLVALVLLIPRQYKAAALFAVTALANLGVILPLYFGKSPMPPPAAQRCTALLMNVNTQLGSPGKVADRIRQLAPDILVLEEVDEAWLSELSGALQSYRHSKTSPRDDNFGIALFSKHPFKRSEIRQVGEADVPSILAEIELPDGPITVIATHPVPPGGGEYSRLRNDQLARLPELVKGAPSPVLLLGDLNATPWCLHFKRLLERSGLRDSAKGWSVQPTWPAGLPPLLIPLDHCLHSPGICITKRSVGSDIGSDHYPLQVEFALASPRPDSLQRTTVSQPGPVTKSGN